MFEFLKSAVEDNPHAGTGVLAREGIVYAESGPNSYQEAPELLLLVTNVAGYIYGHVHQRKAAPEYGRESVWVAVLVESSVLVDGRTPGEALLCAGDAWYRHCSYHPMYAQSEDDVLAVRDSFEDACKVMAEMVRHYDPLRRHGGEREVDGVWVIHEPEGRMDLRIMDLYGLSCALNEEEIAAGSDDGRPVA
ncbi:MAG: hypothetical protein A2286_09555 [Gammaproteobacteria bacterium RIFOXYA12_FULL_61_12]|nr:MAG: hypothetical protein A2514_14405 [Gammaproteobacteria bacterium RIFOXYD12_FULL_61_37]OGT93674.1 MAG: hypothetical protein A2286_09555 [Gammaproteobacteria bacterium RIFOXYA12_FULL_61_12]